MRQRDEQSIDDTGTRHNSQRRATAVQRPFGYYEGLAMSLWNEALIPMRTHDSRQPVR